MLPRRPLGTTGPQVTSLCFGCAALGDMTDTFAYSVPEDRALDTLREAFASPVRFMDTAAAYGDGESERRIGLVLREMGGRLPAGYILATKADRDLRSGDYSGEQFKRSVERSLRLLGLDRLQLVFMHDPEHTTFGPAMASGGPVEVLQRFKEEGVIEHIGVAGGPIDMMMEYVNTGVFEAVITHNRYTLLNQSAEALIDLCARRSVPLLNAAPYGSGLLAKGPGQYPRYAYTTAPQDLIARGQAMAEICVEYGVPLAAAALQFSLRDDRIISTIVGITHPERVHQTLELAAHPIPDELWSRLDAYVGPPMDPEAVRWTRPDS
jgi:D-threo-aldose 1-dehydrogenase